MSQGKGESLWDLAYRNFKRNKTAIAGVFILIFFTIVAVLAPYIAPYDPFEQDFLHSLEGPSQKHLFGTDEFGRDILSRVIYGSRISLQIGFISVFISMFAGTILGVIAGYYGSWPDMLIMRIVDIMLCFPYILLALVIMAILGPGIYNAMIAIGIVYIPKFARIVRSAVLNIRDEEYILAAKSMGAKDIKIMLKHILVNCMAPIIIQGTLSIGRAIINAAGLSFLGLGAQPPTPEWGAILSSGQNFLRGAPWVAIFPGIAIALLVLGFNLIGDGLRDAFDPKMKRT